MIFRFALVLYAVLTALGAGSASAAQTLRGVVLAVLPAKGQAIIRHDAYGGMPAMSMLFDVSALDASRLHEGDRIQATVGEDTNGERLSNIALIAAPAKKPESDALRSVTLLNVGDSVPSVPLLDQNGRSFTPADFRGKIVVMSFVYTRCRDTRMCPLISAHFHQLQERLDPAKYHLVEVTLDPAFDRPAVLAKYATLFDADASRWSIGTGDPRTVLDFAAQFGIVPFADPRVGLIHSERTALISPDGHIADLIDEAAWDPDNVIARLQVMSNAPSNLIALLDYNLSKAVVAVCGNGAAGTSGLLNLVLVAIIFSFGVWLLFRIGRYMYTTKT